MRRRDIVSLKATTTTRSRHCELGEAIQTRKMTRKSIYNNYSLRYQSGESVR